MTFTPVPIPVTTIDKSGCTVPTYQDIYDAYVANYKGIYGADVDLDPDTQDGEWIGIQAQALYDACLAVQAVYLAYSPKSAQGDGLSSVVKINGIRRNVFTFSTAVVRVFGDNGTTITNGLVGDNQNFGTQWALPATVNIGGSGFTDVTATCTTPGDVTALAGTLTQILNPQRGWTSVTNSADAAPGQPVETDAALRQRQSQSTGKPAQTPLQAIKATILDLPGVEDCSAWENDTAATDFRGIPSHSISMVVLGGSVQSIIDVIGSKKSPGCGTFGTTSGTYTDPAGVEDVVNFMVLNQKNVHVQVNGNAQSGWSVDTVPVIQQAVADYINSLTDGMNCNIFNVGAAAALNDQPSLSQTFDITSVLQKFTGGSFSATNLTVAFNERAICNPSDVVVTIP